MNGNQASSSTGSSSHPSKARRTFGAGVAVLLIPLVGLISGGIAHAEDEVATGEPPVPPSADNYVTTTTAADRSLDVSAFSTTCIRNVPAVQFAIVPLGFTPDGPATLTFSDITGNVVGQTTVATLSGQVVYPGAVAGPSGDGLDWPGWRLAADGVSWIPDQSDATLRYGLTIQVQVAGVTAFARVAYVAPDSGCADPPGTPAPAAIAPITPIAAIAPITPISCVTGQNPDGTPAEACALPLTGRNTDVMLLMGAAALLAGLACLAAARPREFNVDMPTAG